MEAQAPGGTADNESEDPCVKAPAESRVLLVDDDDAVRRCLAGVLQNAGYHVTAVGEAVEAVRAAAAEPFSAVVCDQHLGPSRGTDVLREIVGLKPVFAARFILMSGGLADAEDDRARAFAEARPERYLEKPFMNDALLAVLAHVVAPTRKPVPAV